MMRLKSKSRTWAVIWPKAAFLGLFTVILGSVVTAAAWQNNQFWGIESESSSQNEILTTTPIIEPQPSGILLPSSTTTSRLTVHSTTNTNCAFAVGEPLPYDEMTSFDQGAGTTSHQTTVNGINPDPNTVNHVYVRCAANPDFLWQRSYRALSQVNPSFPRTGNLWGWEGGLDAKDPEYVARLDLLLGVQATAAEIVELRQLNPHIRVLTSINAVETPGLPDDYYLKDIYGNKIEVWPDSYRLNLTKLYVAEYQANYAYQTVLDTGLMADGVFFDNVMTTQSWLTHDIYGNPVQIDADEDGLPDDPAALDAAWKAGVFHELQTFRQLMPGAIMVGHAMSIYEAGIADMFNGIGIGFATADVIEGQRAFGDLRLQYHLWLGQARPPATTMIESSPIDQIAYGYGYTPWDGASIPPATLEFAAAYYPWMRFGLALTLLDDGYFAHEFGDAWHGNDWWYDELDFNLGYPLGPSERVDFGGSPGENQIVNGDFESPIAHPWDLWVDTAAGYAATVSRDVGDAAVGTASARIDVSTATGMDWQVEFRQFDRSLEQDANYDLTFWAKSDASRSITLSTQKDSPPWTNYGLEWQRVLIGTTWQKYTVSFRANATAADARIQFMVGEMTGTIWLDDVRLTTYTADVYRREYTNGLALLNASPEAQTIDIGPGYLRLTGTQAPLIEFILDDVAPVFTTTGPWTACAYDSGSEMINGPYYHDWGDGCHEREGSSGEARWDLPITASDSYTITAWWPAAPTANEWNTNVTYEVVANGQVRTAATFNQRTGGDEWHQIAVVPLSPGDNPYVRMTCQGSDPCIADALHIRSQARYNNGAPAETVVLQSMDGIVLARRCDVFLPVMIR